MRRVTRTVFLFFNGLHQLYHTAGTAMETGRMAGSGHQVLCLSCNRLHTEALERVRELFPGTATEIVEIPQPFRYRHLNLKGKLYPSVNAMVRRARRILRDADAVVTTSHGTPGIFGKHGITGPRIIYQYHGCGDRSYGFEKGFRRMDMMLLPGEYHLQRLRDEGILQDMPWKIVGWPKFDITSGYTGKPFPNGNPALLYCPHWEPGLTSYNAFSRWILEYFRHRTDMNLIFAPHLLVKHWRVHHGYEVFRQEDQGDNVIIDYGSTRAVDGTWLRAADFYAGDVSSMVYEFIAVKPRPCVFLNAHGVKWRGNRNYRFWEYGPVADDTSELEAILNELPSSDDSCLALQRERIPMYFHITEKPSSRRAAEAILEYLEGI